MWTCSVQCNVVTGFRIRIWIRVRQCKWAITAHCSVFRFWWNCVQTSTEGNTSSESRASKTKENTDVCTTTTAAPASQIPLQNRLVMQLRCGQGCVFTRVCDSVHRGVCLSACWDTTTPPPPEGGTFQEGNTPPDHAPPRTMHHPGAEHAGRYG